MSARALNKVMLIGNLTRDPELRYTPNGAAVCTFGLATNRSYTPSDSNESQEETEFHKLVAWGKLAEICSQLLYKGRKVYVDGRLQTRKWTGQDGQERVTTEIVIENMIALSPPRGRGGSDDYDQEYEEVEEVVEEEVESKDSKAKAAPAKETKNDTKEDQIVDDEVDVDDIPF